MWLLNPAEEVPNTPAYKKKALEEMDMLYIAETAMNNTAAVELGNV